MQVVLLILIIINNWIQITITRQLTIACLYEWNSEEEMTSYFIWDFIFLESFIPISSQKNGLRNKNGNSTFLLSMQRALKVTTDGLHPFCSNGKEKMLLIKLLLYAALLIYSLSHILLNLFVNNIPICFEGPLDCIYIQVSIKVYIYLYQKVYSLSKVMWDIDLLCFAFLNYFRKF